MIEKAQKPAAVTRPAEPGSRPWQALLVAAAGPVLVLSLLFALEIPLGKPGTLTYVYSPIATQRIGSALAALPLAALAGYAVTICGASSVVRRRAGLFLAALSLVGFGVWSYLAPPEHIKQHVFNMQSPSHDGAFVYEAFQFEDLRAYLRDFPRRAATPPAEMKGTRVISNPPGMTLLAYAVRKALGDNALGILEVPDASQELRFFRLRAGVGLVTLWVLAALWIASAAVLYGVGRHFASAAPAAAFAILSVATPMTLLFAPGKDVAQLFTLSVPLYFWLLAVRIDRSWPAVVAGVALVLGALVSLVHFWLAGIVILATLLAQVRTRVPAGDWPAAQDGAPLRRAFIQIRLPALALAGALGGAAALWLLGLDVIATIWAVARAQSEVTRGPAAMPIAWQSLGVPLFLLFCGPAVWLAVPAGLRRGATPASINMALGRALAALALLVMLITIGFTNMETPRLWIPFVPLLLLAGLTRFDAGTALQPGGQASAAAARDRARLLGVLVFAQIAAGALQWSLMDMRETETRLVGDAPRFFR